MENKSTYKNNKPTLFFILIAILVVILSACASSTGSSNDEESGVELALDETYNRVRNGARLFLTYDPENNSFNGFVENTTDDTLKRVRVEVHLSNGVELGPTTPVDLAPGERKDIKLSAKNFEFDSWTAHPEVGEDSSEHGDGKEGEGEHSEGGSD